MSEGINLKMLRAYFAPHDIEWKLGNVNKGSLTGLAMPYITSRAIQNRLDETCGPENWQDEYRPWKEKSQLCGISINTANGWVTKWDGADDTAYQATKGGLSDSFKRAAVKWGIGRYLYNLPPVWVPVVQIAGKDGKFKMSKEARPTLPERFLPKGVENTGYTYDYAQEDEMQNAQLLNGGRIGGEEAATLTNILVQYHLSPEKLLAHYRIKTLEELSIQQYNDYIKLLSENIDGFKLPKKSSVIVTRAEVEGLKAINEKVGGKR